MMDKVLIFSRHDTSRLKRLLKKFNFSIGKRNPDFILSYGGDGTVLYAERKFPSIPKLLVKTSEICRKCDYTFSNLKNILPRLKAGKFKIKYEMKLEARYKTEKLTGLNEIQLHAKLPIRAVRFSLSVDGQKFANLIGDGAIVSTPFGSPAYYSSVGGKIFDKGIGIGFNNLHNKKIPSFVVSENSKIRIKISRDNAWLAGDNNEKLISLKANDVVTIKKSNQVAKFITF